MRFLQILVVTYFALLSLLPAYSQTVEYDGQQDLRPTFMGTAYEIEGGPHDGKRGYLFRIWNREGIPVQLTAIPGQFNQPVNSILGVSAQYSDGSYSFVGDTQPYRELFSGGTETLNPSPSGSIQDRPANFIAIVDPSVDTLVFSLNGRTATGSYAAAQIEPLVLAQDAGPNVAVSFKTDGLTYGEFLSAISQASSSTIDIVSDVFVDGIRVGDIPESGPLMLSLEPGAHAISGAIERLVGGRQSVDIVEGQTYNLTIDMTGEELASILDNRLVVNDSSAPVIDTATSEFRIDFETPGGGKFGLGDIFFVHAARIQPDLNFGGPPKQISKAEDITGHFQLDSNGRLYSPNPSGLIAALQSVGSGPYELMVSSSDVDQGLPLEGSIVIRLSQYALNGAVIRLPSSSAFPLDGIPVTAQSMTGGVSTTEITAADGSFSFGRLPEDTYKVSAETLFSSEVLAIEGVVSLNEPANLALTPLSLSQTVAGEQGFEIVSGASTATRLAPDTQARNLSTEKKRTNAIKSEWDRKGAPRGRPTGTIRKNSKFKLVAPASDEEAQTDGGTSRQLTGPVFSIDLDSESGTTQTQTIQVEVPGNQTTVTLGYYIQLQPGSAVFRDYPDYWNIQLRDQDGSILYSSGNSFSTSIRSPSVPVFFEDFGSYTTDYITEAIDLPASQTPANDRVLTLTVTAATSWESEIFAYISAEFLDIPLIKIAASGPAISNAPSTARFPNVPGNVISLPDSGERNAYNIRLPITVQRVDTGESVDPADVTSVDVEILFGAGGAGGSEALYSEIAPIQQLQLRPNSSTVYELDVSFIAPTSASVIDTSPPSDSEIAYRVMLEASGGGSTVRGEGVVRGLTGFYQTAQPLGLTRTGVRDNGGDDWAQKSLYDWLTNNSNQISAMNDISGEHGRDLGHASHRRGLDLDMNFFDATQPGSVEYVVLLNNVISAVQGNQGSINAVTNYISTQQVGIEALAAQNVLSNIFGPIGGAQAVPAANGYPAFSLPAGWAGVLFEDGVVRDIHGTVLLDINRSMNAEAGELFSPYPGHNDHLHLSFLEDAG